MEERVFFGGDAIRLEGLHAAAGGGRGVVISHPHPLMGGDMENPVVEILSEVLFAAGISTLRFTFRGVGRSAGAFDGGQGEQEDVLAAVSFLEERGNGEVALAGYSFGSWVNAAVLVRKRLLPAILVAPPITLCEFDFDALRGRVGAILCGDRDQFCPAELVRIIADDLPCRLDLIPGADHFFMAKETELGLGIKAFAAQLDK